MILEQHVAVMIVENITDGDNAAELHVLLIQMIRHVVVTLRSASIMVTVTLMMARIHVLAVQTCFVQVIPAMEWAVIYVIMINLI